MKKTIALCSIIILILSAAIYFVFVHPRDDKIYFNYPTEHLQYSSGKIEFRLNNENPDNSKIDTFVRVLLKVEPDYVESCNTDDFEWELRKLRDDMTLVSTQNGGSLSNTRVIKNKIGNSVFKVISGPQMGKNDFLISVTFRPNNGCGVSNTHLEFTQIMRLKIRRRTVWDDAMSV